jgi:hypothetical protein
LKKLKTQKHCLKKYKSPETLLEETKSPETLQKESKNPETPGKLEDNSQRQVLQLPLKMGRIQPEPAIKRIRSQNPRINTVVFLLRSWILTTLAVIMSPSNSQKLRPKFTLLMGRRGELVSRCLPEL